MEEIEFTQSQQQAIDHGDGPALVVAGAGTGKTAVITTRIARLILSGMARPDEVLALTFTEKAATEMQQRVDELLPYGYVDTQIMTFHALAERLLREYALDAGISPEFKILNDVQQIVIMQEVLAESKYDYFNPRYHPFALIRAIRATISRLKDEGVDNVGYSNRLEGLEGSKKVDFQSLLELKSIYDGYTEGCKRINGLDFGDLLIKIQQLLEKKTSIRNEIIDKYKYILVDEFQDTNPLQMKILQNLLNKSNNIMVVGDDDQAIYRFRGASVQNILNFRKIFPESRLLVLNDNFRSGQAILDAGYRLIQNNNPQRLEVGEKIDKRLKANTNPKAKVAALQYANKATEIDEVVEKIKTLVESGIEQKDIAILLRKNSQIKPYIQSLQKKKIEYYVHQDVELFEQTSVKTITALCAVLVDLDDSGMLFQLLISGFFEDIDRHKIIAMAASARKANSSLYDYIYEKSDDLHVVCGQLKEWQELVSTHTAGELLFVAIKQSGYLKRRLSQAEANLEAAIQIQYLTDFFKLVKQFEQVSSISNLVEFNRYLAEISLASAEIMSEISPLDISGVQIMTVHKAKGLEFDYVFMPELTEQTFPTYRQAEPVKIPEGILSSPGGDHYQEERRLFYVGLTRAKRLLWLSYALDHGGKQPKRPSRFISEALAEGAISARPSKQSSMAELIRSFEPVNVGQHSNLLARLYKGDWLYLTTNQIADYLRSPREFWLFHVLNMPKGPFHSLVYGSAIHAALEHFYKYRMAKKRVKEADLLRVFADSWTNEGFVSIEHEQRLFEDGKRCIVAYAKAHSGDKVAPVAIEQPFELQIPSLRTVIVGRYDAVLESDRGIEIRDFKTSRVKDQKSADKKAKNSIQLGIYALSWEKLQQKPVMDTSLEFVEDLVVGRAGIIDNEKTLNLITQAVSGIRAQEFSEIGQSRVDFNRLLV